MLLAEQLHALVRQIQELNRRLLAWHRQDQASQRLATIPGVSIISATASARQPLKRQSDGSLAIVKSLSRPGPVQPLRFVAQPC